jgi:hypothetical protein
MKKVLAFLIKDIYFIACITGVATIKVLFNEPDVKGRWFIMAGIVIGTLIFTGLLGIILPKLGEKDELNKGKD